VKKFRRRREVSDLDGRAILAPINLISKIHEHDNTNLYKQFKDLIGDHYSQVHHVRQGIHYFG
jgi:N utilization substance protein A